MPARKSGVAVTAVIAKKALGESNSKIAIDLDMNRDTVARILESSSFPQAIEYGSIRVHRMIPKTCDALERVIAKDNVPAILAVLNGTGILKPAESKQAPNVQVLVQIQARSIAIAKEIAAFQAEDE